jgi:hypothetical protein
MSTKSQSKELLDVLQSRDGYSTTQEWLRAVLGKIGHELSDDDLERVVTALRGHYGAEYLKIREEYEPHVEFWRALAERVPERHELRAILADTLLLAGRRPEATELFLDTFEQEPTLLSKFGGDLIDLVKPPGSHDWLRYQLINARAALGRDPEDEDEYARDVLRELVRLYKDDPAALKKIYSVAESIPGASS